MLIFQVYICYGVQYGVCRYMSFIWSKMESEKFCSSERPISTQKQCNIEKKGSDSCVFAITRHYLSLWAWIIWAHESNEIILANIHCNITEEASNVCYRLNYCAFLLIFIIWCEFTNQYRWCYYVSVFFSFFLFYIVMYETARSVFGSTWWVCLACMKFVFREGLQLHIYLEKR